MNEPIDYWASDDFEDTVAAALISCFESKIKKNKGVFPFDTLNKDSLSLIRATAPYIASNSRIIEVNENYGVFDIINDELPTRGMYAHVPCEISKKDWPGAYLMMHHIRRVNKMSKYWIKLDAGELFEIYFIAATSQGITGERRYFTVTKEGKISSCDQRVSNVRGYVPGIKTKIIGQGELILKETSQWAGISLQTIADKKHCWTITAQENIARAYLGCMKEEVKSLLYARSLPMTETGRKRPILHLVEAHKRRMKNGTDIDVTQFLRGTQTVEMAGTLFTVNPPKNLYPNVTKPSQEKYYSAD